MRRNADLAEISVIYQQAQTEAAEKDKLGKERASAAARDRHIREREEAEEVRRQQYEALREEFEKKQ